MHEPSIVHSPVLSNKLQELLDYPENAVVVDATIGQGGHALLLAKRLGHAGRLIGLDVDDSCLAVARNRLQDVTCRIEMLRENFSQLDAVLKSLGVERVDVILADLGVNSAQLADADRGISFQDDGPLDMRLDDRLESDAAKLVNFSTQDELADLIWRFGEERHSRRISRKIVEARKHKPIQRTHELVKVINDALKITTKGRRSKIHPATRTFQALRIAVNDELGHLGQFLAKAPGLLKTGGQVAVISFHSLEDRLVKWSFRENKQAGNFEILTRKPVGADQQERQENPRSRSAKLRIARRIEATTA